MTRIEEGTLRAFLAAAAVAFSLAADPAAARSDRGREVEVSDRSAQQQGGAKVVPLLRTRIPDGARPVDEV